MTARTKSDPGSGNVIFVPLNRLKKSPKNARKTPHAETEIEALAASIAAKGLLQNLVVEPERDADDKETGHYLVTIGEGRRLAQVLRVKRKQIKKGELIRCVLDTEHDAHEISLAENVVRTRMHPADEFEAFKRLIDDRGMSAEDIAARFGVTPQVVRQRLRLGAVSPKLMQVYRDGALSLEQLMAFALTEDHARQEQVYDNLSYNEASVIRRMLTEAHVSARDRRARFIGAEAYEAAGGAIIRDLFTEDHGGYFADAVLLDRLVLEKLQAAAANILSEGWKWAEAHVDFPHAHGMRRVYPHPVPLSRDDQDRLDAVQAEFEALSAEYESAEELPDDIDAKFGELEAEIERLSDQQQAYDPEDAARSGVFVVLNHDGTVRLERGFVRPADETQVEPTTPDEGESGTEQPEGSAADAAHTGEGDDRRPLSDLLVRDLTAHRTAGLRVALGEQPEVALIAVTHALAAQVYYHEQGSCLTIRADQPSLTSHAEGIEDMPSAKTLSDRHANWARQLPEDVNDLWAFVVALDADSRMALLAHCVASTVNAVSVAWATAPCAGANAGAIAHAVGLDMTAFWTPTSRTYFGRVSKARILEAVTEAVSAEAANRLAEMKKQAMADAAEQLLAGTRWLPPLLRTLAPSNRSDEARALEPQQIAAE
jgi:ParB family chromosome partitioning protein